MNERRAFSVPLDLLLLIILAPAHLWFNPVSSALAVALLSIYALISLFSPRLADEHEEPRRRHRFLFLVRFGIVAFFVMMAVVAPTGLQIISRLEHGPSTNAHDGMVQTEVAIQFLLDGKNPYREDYFGTIMEEWEGEELPWPPTDAALYHNAYLPALFIAPLPLYVLSHALLGWYDQRIFYLLAYGLFLVLLAVVVPEQRYKLAALLAVGLNLLFPHFLAEGRNDVVILATLMLTTYLLASGHPRLASLALGFAVAAKQMAWFFVPFYFIFLLPDGMSWADLKRVLRQTWPLFLAVAVIVGPFLAWDARAFIDDTFLYLIGATEHSWPIRGMGFSTLLLATGIVDSVDTRFPFFVLQLLVGLPLFFVLVRHQLRHNTLRAVWVNFSVFSLVTVYFSRFLHDNYVVFILQTLITAAFLPAVSWRQIGQTIWKREVRKAEVDSPVSS
jgi:hypothetical protein